MPHNCVCMVTAYSCQVMDDPEWTNVERVLDVVELWSGVGNIYNVAQQRQLNAKPFDKQRLPAETLISEDITGH